MPLALFVVLQLLGASPIDDFMRPIGPSGDPHVIAHRGFSGVAPENTLAAFRRAIAVGADMFELDVLLSKDGHVVVIHDETVDRTTDGTGKVSDLTLDELTALDAGSWFAPEFEDERIPTLAHALRLAKDQILVNIEIKTEAVTDELRGGIVEKTLEVVNALTMKDSVVISSFDPRALAQMRALDSDIRTATLYSERMHGTAGPGEAMKAVGSNGFNSSHSQVEASMVEECHRLGRPIAVYTVNEEADMHRVIELGVDAIFTDRPDRLIELLSK